jgi:hypothetical protein
MRKINKIIVHCLFTPPSMDIGVEEVKQWHLARGFRDIGYHDVIRRSGVSEKGRPIEKIGAHVRGHNSDSIGIALAGGMSEEGNFPEFNYTKGQLWELEELVKGYKIKYPEAVVEGHNFYDPKKECPCLDVKEWWNENRT